MEGPRTARADELDEVLDLVNYVFRTSQGREPDMGRLFPWLFGPASAALHHIVTEDGRVVSHFGVIVRDIHLLGATTRVGSLGSVCTHPDYQGRGIATRLLGHVENFIADQGGTFTFISGGRGLYRRSGAVDMGGVLGATIRRDRLPSPEGLTVRTLGDEDIPAAASL
jgi:GNAT superfamily N-acetyltransferase